MEIGQRLVPTGLLPDRETCVGRVIDSARWSEAGKWIAELISYIQPNEGSEKRRKDVADYIQSLIGKCFSCQVHIFGSVPLMTYLPDGDIDLTVIGDDENTKDTWANTLYRAMEEDKMNENAEFHVEEVHLIVAEVKVIKCLVDGIVVDITFYQTGGLRALTFLEEVNRLINQFNLFRRSIILIKAWCYYESRILGAHHGLISTYALETMIVYIFHLFDNSFAGPLEVLYRFLEYFSNFDWENFCVSIWGPVPKSLLPDIAVIPPRKDNGEFHHKNFFLKSHSKFIDRLTCGQHCQRRSFVSKFFNVVDPLCAHNNLGRSVYKGNFYRIRSAFAFGAKKLARILDFPMEEMTSELSRFFMNTWERHRAGLHNSSIASVELLKPYESIRLEESNTFRNISNKEQNDKISEDPGGEQLPDVGPSFYGISSQILRMISPKSEDISRPNEIRTTASNAKNEEDYRSDIIIRNQDYVEKASDSAKHVRTNKKHENLSCNNSNNIEEGDCRLRGQHGMLCSANTCFRSHPVNVPEVSSGENDDMVQKPDTHQAFHVSSEYDGRSKNLASKIKSSQVVTSIDDSSCSKQNPSLQSTDSNGASHSFHDSASSTIETSLSNTHSQHSYNEHPAQEIHRAPPKDGNYEVPINETGQISNGDHIISTGQFFPSNSQQRPIANSAAVPSTLYPTGPPVPFLEMLQTYNFPFHRSYYDGLYGLSDEETLNFDRNMVSGGMFDQPEIQVATPVMPILSHGLPSPNISLLGPSPYAYPTLAPNTYFQRIFPPIRPILPQGSQFVPAAHVLPEAQMRTSDMLTLGDGVTIHPGGIRTYPISSRVALRDQSPTTEHYWNYNHYGGNLDEGQQNCYNRSPQGFWFNNDPNHSEMPTPLTGCLTSNYSQSAGSFDLCRSDEINLAGNSSIGSSSLSHVSTYMTQGMDCSQLLTAQFLPPQHQRLMFQNNLELKEEGFPR